MSDNSVSCESATRKSMPELSAPQYFTMEQVRLTAGLDNGKMGGDELPEGVQVLRGIDVHLAGRGHGLTEKVELLGRHGGYKH